MRFLQALCPDPSLARVEGEEKPGAAMATPIYYFDSCQRTPSKRWSLF